jgi:hypothetical protein
MRELKAPAEPMNRATALAMQLNDQKEQEAVPRSQMSCYLDRTNRVLPTLRAPACAGGSPHYSARLSRMSASPGG